METEVKYYTPEISEFVEGFEYEFRSPFGKTVNFPWEKLVYSIFPVNNFEDFYYGIQDMQNNIRVKYLTAEDIESLGFITDSIYSYKKGDYYIELDFDIYRQIKQVEIYMVHDCLFKGYIKNKNELIKLLKQLGIKQ